RDDAPEQAAYDIAKAIDEHHDGLKWYIRPYSYDPRTAWSNIDVPLHPGAERYYREVGYLTGTNGKSASCADASVESSRPAPASSSCAVHRRTRTGAGRFPAEAAALLGAALASMRRRRAAGTASTMSSPSASTKSRG